MIFMNFPRTRGFLDMSPIRKKRPLAALIVVLATVAGLHPNPSAAANSPSAREDQILIMGLVSGSQTVTPQGTDSVRVEYSFNDRGRGDHIIATWKLVRPTRPERHPGNERVDPQRAHRESSA